MGEFSKRELEIIDYIVETVSTEIFIKDQEETDKSKLDYALCSDDIEKNELTKKKIAILKSKIDKCNSEVALYLIEFTKPTPIEFDFYVWRDHITKNFIISTYQELIEELSVLEQVEIEKYTFSSIVKSKGYKYKPLKEYIQGVCDISLYMIYKSFLEIPLDENQELSKPIIEDITKPMTYNDNLSNDPLFNPANEYLILKEKFIEEYQSRTAQYPDFDYLFLVDDDVNLKEWEKTQKEKINNAFLKLIKDLNNNNILFFGCSFDNYKFNYDKRLDEFLINFYDTSETEFITGELKFLENILYDFENGTGGMDEFSMSDVDIFKKASYVVSMISYEQYCYSNNKKINFLKERKDLLSNINVKKYNNLLYLAKTHEVKELLTEIFYKNLSIFNVVNYINEKTTVETYNLFINEFNTCYEFICNEFMFHAKEEDIKKAIDIFEKNLEYIYVDEKEFSHIKHFVRIINNYKTVFNVRGFSFEKKENAEKIIYLNNLMIDYYNDFFENHIECFENISHLRSVYYYLNKLSSHREPLSIDYGEIEISNTRQNHHIFTNNFGQIFFNELHSEFKDSNTILADYSFIFRMMIKEAYINDFIKPEMFKSWLCKEPFSIILDNKLKTLDRCTTSSKKTAYNSIKSKVKNNLV